MINANVNKTTEATGPATPSPQTVLAAAIVEAIRDAGTEVAFGVPGSGSTLELLGVAEREGLRFVLCHMESAAAIAAGAYGELTGRLGVCLVTRGPGAASCVNGTAQALLDRVPLLVISEAVGHGEWSRIAHQRIDQRTLYTPVTKWTAAAGAADGREVVRRAIEIAYSKPQGPVHIDFVADAPPCDEMPAVEHVPSIDEDALQRAMELLSGASNPVVIVGVGARDVVPQVRSLIQSAGCLALTTYKAKGAVPETWPHFAGLLTGGTIEAPVLEQADLLVGIGFDSVELIPGPWPYDAPLVSFAEWPEKAGFFEPAVEVVAPLQDVLPRLAPYLTAARPAGSREDWLMMKLKLEAPTEGLSPQEVVNAVREIADPSTIATIDSGAHMLVVMPLWEVDEPGQALISSGLGSMGFAVPAAIGAAVARPSRHVVAFTGDGGLGMTIGELETLARLNLRVVVVVLDDSALTMVKIKMTDAHGGFGSVDYDRSDFAAIARGYGLPAFRADDGPSLGRAVRAAFDVDGPAVVHAVIDPGGYKHVIGAIRGARARGH